MPPDIPRNFAAARGVAHMDRVLQIKLVSKGCEIVSIRVHVVAVPGLGGAAVPAPVMRNNAIATLAEKQHLSIPVVRGERPAVAEHDRLARSPVLVENLCSIFCRDRRHEKFSPLFAMFC